MASIPLLVFLSLLLSFPLSSLAQLYTSSCPLLGPDFPAPVAPSKSQAVIDASKLMVTALQRALTNTTVFGSLDPNSTTFSVQLFSLYEPEPLFTYHYGAPALANPKYGAAIPDSNSIYRIGSISKLLTIYTYLVAAGDASWSHPITDYVPELAQYAETNADTLETDDIDKVNWSQITVGALASQLGGIGRDDALPPIVDQTYRPAGLPPVPPSNASYCGEQAVQFPCDRAGMRHRRWLLPCFLYTYNSRSFLRRLSIPPFYRRTILYTLLLQLRLPTPRICPLKHYRQPHT
jgi:hypothetical protein